MTYEQWLKYGIDKKFCSEQFCDIHGAVPIVDAEQLLIDDDEYCVFVVRLGNTAVWEQNAIDLQNQNERESK